MIPAKESHQSDQGSSQSLDIIDYSLIAVAVVTFTKKRRRRETSLNPGPAVYICKHIYYNSMLFSLFPVLCQIETVM